ncbi:type II secretion system F family protein [Vibrio sp. JPW-9-11-11]|uniref:type II secretion system F family protein n=1 Tax=Vibrio sp. JPW-9-11-11 TaxID=1416532 RepID=UPI0015934F57|nr:type II secretion system F family protein [Vibrio sp. JPW-9-11-11]NVD05683.1 type II secretion system F family protein [Vibrio sp. JPW-9-11-11]
MLRSKLSQKLYRFDWQGIDNSGTRQCGQEITTCEHQLKQQLQTQQISLLTLKRHSLSTFAHWRHSAHAHDITAITRQLATLLASGVTLSQSLKLIGQGQKKAEVRWIVSHLSRSVEAGTPISQAMQHTHPLFDAFYLSLIKVAEQSGQLSEVVAGLARYREDHQQLQTKLKTAMIYPSIVIMTAAGVTYLMLTFVVPQFKAMFVGLGAELPWFTQQVLDMSELIRAYGGFLVFTILGLAGVVAKFINASPNLRRYCSYLSLKIPIFGSLKAHGALHRFCHSLAINVSAGIPIHQGLSTAINTLHHPYYQCLMSEVYQNVLAGMPMYIALRESKQFPDLMIQMVMVGEESGQLENMLFKLANTYQSEIDTQVEQLEKSLEPLLVLILATIVGSLVVAMYLPIFNLMNVLG